MAAAIFNDRALDFSGSSKSSNEFEDSHVLFVKNLFRRHRRRPR